MKRFFKFIFISIVVVTMSFTIFNLTNEYKLNILSQNIEWSISMKGCVGARSFDFDDKGNLYIAFNDTIRVIDNEGKDKLVIRKADFDILDILCNNNKLYISTDNRIIEYDIISNEIKELIKEIPNLGVNKKVNLLVKDNILYFSIGSNTNSGIVDKKDTAYDIPTGTWILSGNNYGENSTGAFSPYAVITEKGEKITEKKIGNATVLEYDFNNASIMTYAHGIRSVMGWDFDSKGQIKAIVSGMEDKEPRAVKGDKDYIYELKNDSWYGWPDYSGGDPITSPRFTEGNRIESLIENHPDKTPMSPLYQYKDVSALGGLAIDREGIIFEKDAIIFGDNKQGLLYKLKSNGGIMDIADLGDNSKIEKIKFSNDKFYILDSGIGCIYKLEKNSSNSIYNLPKIIWIFIIAFFIIILVSGVIKLKKR